MPDDLPNVFSLDARMRESQGAAAPTLFDDELALLLDWPALADPAFLAPLRGEALLRGWLYARNPLEILERALSPALREHGRTPPPAGAAPVPAALTGEEDRAAWHYAAQRLADFRAADGIIALASRGRETALAVPFTLDPAAPAAAARDAAGNVIEAWSAGVGALEAEFGASFRFRIGAVLNGAEAESIDGGSFGLPVWLARARRDGRLGEYPTLGLLASGTVMGRQTGTASHLTAKAALANRLGALFAAPGDGGRAETLVLRTGLPLEEARINVAAALVDGGHARMTPREALASLRRLHEAVHHATISLDAAACRLAVCEAALAALGAGPSSLLEEARAWVEIIRQALANHRGETNAERPGAAVAPVARTARQMTLDEAGAIVALTDQGRLEEAASRGEALLGRAIALFGEERLHCEMTAAGVLGGQPLLQRALLGEPCGERSLALLERALACARELEDPREIARDVTQIALWHALLQPAESERACLRAAAELAPLPPEWRAVSTGYLQRVRWLGAYRRCLLAGGVPEHFEDWPLPAAEIGEGGWLRATACKYRGALRAASGRTEAASEDFAAACAALFASDAALPRFIGATAALQAAESLAALRPAAADKHRQIAEVVFIELAACLPRVASPGWRARCLNPSSAAAPHPQLHCVY